MGRDDGSCVRYLSYYVYITVWLVTDVDYPCDFKSLQEKREKKKKKKEQKKEGGVGSKKRKVLKGSGPPCFAAVIVVSRDVCRIGDLVT